ncbi:hypothetical protein [Clostridium tertium]
MKGIGVMWILMYCTYISIIPIILIFCDSIGINNEFQEFHDYLDCK